MTRVVAGVAGGRRLLVPRGPTRPTSERVKEALFSALESARSLEGTRVLDLYAGSGALGLEALSRGASVALLVDADRRAAEAIRRNVRTLGVSGAEVRQAKVQTVLRERAGPGDGERFDVVFADPPYAMPDSDLASALQLLTAGWLAPDATVVVERRANRGAPSWPEGLTATREKRYGDSTIHWARFG